MPVKLSEATNVDSVQLQDQAGDVSTPSSGYGRVFCKGDEPYWISDAGTVTGLLHGGSESVGVYAIQELPLELGGGDANIEVWRGAPSINFDADGEVVYVTAHIPTDRWDGASNIELVAMVGNEIAEDDGDDVSFTCTVHGVADGEAETDAGQAVALTLNLTGGDEAINVVNEVSGGIDYDHGTYPIAEGDTIVIKCAVNLGEAGECTGPLHIISWYLKYQSNRRGEQIST